MGMNRYTEWRTVQGRLRLLDPIKTRPVKGTHIHLGRTYILRPDSADTIRCPFCGQERKA